MDVSMRRSKSTESLKNRYSSSQACKLFWSDLAKAPFISYLNLIDLECKKNIFKSAIPWHHIPFSDADILHFSSQSVYNDYKKMMLTKIDNCNLTELSCLVRKLLYVSKKFEIPLDVNTTNCLYYSILHCLFDRGLKDSSLLLTVWNTLCVSDKLKVAVFSGLIGKHRKRKSAKLLDYILKSALDERFDFWGAWTKNFKHDNFPYCPVTAALLSGNVEQMHVLLKYGFEPNSQRIATYDKYFLFCLDNVYEWLRKPLLESASPRRKIITEVLLFLANVAVSQSQIKRISMTRCFFLLWDVIPTPYVTKAELQNEIQLRFLFPPFCSQLSYFPSTQGQFLRLCEFYETVFFGDEVAQLEPRSLKHLCKCTIREELQKSWNLPEGIDDLPLPKQLKEYLDVNL